LKLTILSVAYPFANVGPDAVGGAEQVLAQVERAAVDAGHRSIVIAMEGSQVAGELLPIPRHEGVLDQATRAEAHAAVRHAIARALRSEDIDVLHFHGMDFAEYLPELGPPALITLHLPPDWYPFRIWRSSRPRTYFHCVSESQQERCPERAHLWPVIPNGVEVKSFHPRDRKCGFALMLGRICPEKGFHIGLDASSHAGTPLWIGGKVFGYQAHQQYFYDQIQPRIQGTNHRFLGEVGSVRKRRLLRAAQCLLVPSLVPETSSLVAMEAFASGTPVIAFRSGALARIVEHGVTGFLVKDACEMAEAILHAGDIDPKACRRVAEERFNLTQTTEAYLAAYQRLFEEEWRALYDRSSGATPFASPEWLSGVPLEFAKVRRNGELVAMAGLGEMQLSDYQDVLTVDRDAAQALWAKLPSCTLNEIPPDSPFLQAITAETAETEDASWCPFVRLDRLSLPGKLDKNLRLQRRKLEERGGEFCLASAGQADEYLDALFELHSERWGGDGVLKSDEVKAFHRRVLPGFAQRGWLRFHGIRLEGRLRAVLYAFAKDRRVYYYLSGFDPALAEYGPGSLLIQEAMRYALTQGDSEFDFLRGAEPYKYRWGAENRINTRLRKI
jgi:glycosyltransferase involved in cell wall biosynthesis